MSFLAVLPIAGYGLFVAIARSRGSGRRSSAIHAAAVWGVVALVLTETLSAVHALTAAGLAVGWLAVDVAAGAWLARSIPSFVPGAFAKLGGLERAFVAAMLATLAVAGLVAVAAPPNTTDAMVYHLPRIVHWLENRTVAFYPTHELKQLRMAPWAEYAMLQVHALSGGDRLDNLVEWFSFAGSLLGVSLIAGRLGAGLRGQVLAAALCATLPSAVLEASSAKNDCVAGFWLVAMAYYLLCFVGKQTTGSLLGFGCALGLALLTKSTLWVSAPAVIAFLAIPMGWRMRSLAPAVLLALALNAPHLIRNYALFHAPFGPAAEIPPRGFKYTNDRFGVGPAASNILRNVALHATTPWQPLNRVTEAGVRGALRLLHEDPDDPATTWDFTEFHVPPYSLHEATAGNPLHACLILLACALLLVELAGRGEPARVAAGGGTGGRLRAVLRGVQVAALAHAAAPAAIRGGHGGLRHGAGAVLAALGGGGAGRGGVPSGDASAVRQCVAAAHRRPRTEYPGHAARRSLLCRPHGPDAGLSGCRKVVCGDAALQRDRAGHGGRTLRVSAVGSVGRLQRARVRHRTPSSPMRRPSTRRRGPPAACVVCPDCAAQGAAWLSLERQFAGVHEFAPVAVLTGRGQAKPSACSAEFPGWYQLERGDGNSWRWSAGKAAVRILAAEDLDASLEGALASIRQPNTVEVTVNGGAGLRLSITEPGLLPIRIPVHLRKGWNAIEFASRNDAVRPPGESRPLAMALYNLAVRTEGALGCELDQ